MFEIILKDKVNSTYLAYISNYIHDHEVNRP